MVRAVTAKPWFTRLCTVLFYFIVYVAGPVSLGHITLSMHVKELKVETPNGTYSELLWSQQQKLLA